MADKNQITYTDLVKPTTAITDAIKQLDDLDKSYTKQLEKVKKSAESVSTATKGLSGATSEQREQIKKNAKEVDKLAVARKRLTESQSNNGIELAKLKAIQQEQNKLTKLELQLNKSKEGSYNKLSAQYSLNSAKLDKMSAAQRKGTIEGRKFEKKTNDIREEMNRMKKATGNATLQVGQYEKAQNKANKVVGKAGSGFKKMLKPMLAAGAAMLTFRAAFKVLSNGLKTIANFEQAMSKVKAVTGALPKDFKALSADAQRLGSITAKSATQVAGLQLEFAKLGFSTAEILNATEATISLSIAAGSDLAESAVVAASTIRGFGLNASETQRVVDVMAKSFSSSALDLEKFKTAMGAVAPVAKAAGKDIEFTSARLSILADSGLDASTAGTSLRNMFLELNKQGLTWEQGLEKINTSTNKNVTALDLFGKRGATAALILADNVDKANNLEKAYDSAAGSAKEMADIMEDNLIGDVTKLSSAWEGFILGLNKGEGTISNTFRGLTQWLTKVVTMFNLANKSKEELIESVKDKTIRESIEKDAKQVEELAEIMGDYDKALEATILSVETRNLDWYTDEEHAAMQSRIDALKALRVATKEANEEPLKSNTDTSNTDTSNKNKPEELEFIGSNIDKLKLIEINEKQSFDNRTAFQKEGAKQRLALLDQETQGIINKLKKRNDAIIAEQERGTPEYSFYERLGLIMNDEDKAAVVAGVSAVVSAIQQVAQAQIEAADRAVDATNNKVSSAESALDVQLELQAQGYAANVRQAQKDLALEKKSQTAALKQQAKAQKAQERINTLSQASSLITAAAQLWASYSTMGPLSVGFAIAATAAMFGSFAFSKIKTAQVAKQEYGDGDFSVMEGGSHASGNDIFLGNQGGVDEYMEGGEGRGIINKRNTQKYKNILPDVFNSLNKGTFEKKYMKSFDGNGMNFSIVNSSADLKTLEGSVDEIRKQGERRFHTVGNKTVETYKNLTRTYNAN